MPTAGNYPGWRARRALIFAEEGRVHLVQRRHGDGDYSYLAIKARTPGRRTR